MSPHELKSEIWKIEDSVFNTLVYVASGAHAIWWRSPSMLFLDI